MEAGPGPWSTSLNTPSTLDCAPARMSVLSMFRYYALTSVRSLGRTGLRVAIGESARQYRFGLEPQAFHSRY
jgi:hypothetical protein